MTKIVIAATAVGLLIASYFFTGTATVAMKHEFRGNYLEVADLHMDIAGYPKYTDGQVIQGDVLHFSEDRDSQGNPVKNIKYLLHGSYLNNSGERVYTYLLPNKEVVADVVSYTEKIKEHNNVRWTFRQNGEMVSVLVEGTREIPWLFYPFLEQHNLSAMDMLKRIELEISGS